MPTLRDLQLVFADSVLAGHDRAAEWLRVRNGTPAARLAIYRNNTLTNLRGTLREVYPIIDQLVGAAFFDRMAAEFIAAHPSQSGDLNDYGGGFEEFIAGFAPAAALLYLPDVARLEWVLEKAYYAADRGSMQLARLAEVPPERYADLRLVLHPAATLVRSRYPLQTIWEVHQPGYVGDGHVDLGVGDTALLVTRRGLDVIMEPLDQAEFLFLALIVEGQPFAIALTAALERDEAFPLQARLARRVLLGDVVDFALDGV